MTQALRAFLCVLTLVAATQAAAAEWQPNTFYALGAQVTYQGPFYQCITAHTSQVGWEPNVAGSLWLPASGTPVPTATATPTPTPISGTIEITPGGASVTASTQDTNVPANTVDNNLLTRWSGNGDGAWIRFDLGTIRTVANVRVAVHQGNARRNSFDLQLSTDAAAWTTVFSGQSSGTTTQEQTYDFADQSARYVRYVGHGATLNAGGSSTWNSVAEISVFGPGGTPCPQPTPIPTPRPIGLVAAAGDAQVSLSWQSGMASTGAHEYEVLRSTTSGGPYTMVATVNRSGTRDASHVDTGLSNGTTYYYVVREIYTWTYSCTGQVFRVPSASSDQASAVPQAGVSPTATPTPTPTPTFTPTPTPPCCTAVEVTPGAGSVSASTNDGNLPANTVDNSLSTRWSANGDGQWVKYDLGTARTLTHVTIGFYSGNQRQSRFDIQVSNDNASWTNVLTGGLSSGTTTQEQLFDVTDASARWVRYLGHGNTVNSWNSLVEVSLFALPGGGPTPTPTATPTPNVQPTPTPTPTPSWKKASV